MEDFIQAIAVLLILGLSALSSMSKEKKKREQMSKGLDSENWSPPERVPARPPKPKPAQMSQPPAPPKQRFPGHSLEGESLEGRSYDERVAERRRKKLQRRQPAQTEYTHEQDASPQHEMKPFLEKRSEPLSPPDGKRDVMTEIFKTLLDADDPELVYEEPPRPPKKPVKITPPKAKKKTAPRQEPPKKSAPRIETPRPLAPAMTAAPGAGARHPFFVKLARDAEQNPLKTAIIMSEVLRRPRQVPALPRLLERR
ncbi:MAG: hypothetical protein GC154_01425 [bacterium]|nr:hypothetical protein [bacterium]